MQGLTTLLKDRHRRDDLGTRRTYGHLMEEHRKTWEVLVIKGEAYFFRAWDWSQEVSQSALKAGRHRSSSRPVAVAGACRGRW